MKLRPLFLFGHHYRCGKEEEEEEEKEEEERVVYLQVIRCWCTRRWCRLVEAYPVSFNIFGYHYNLSTTPTRPTPLNHPTSSDPSAHTHAVSSLLVALENARELLRECGLGVGLARR